MLKEKQIGKICYPNISSLRKSNLRQKIPNECIMSGIEHHTLRERTCITEINIFPFLNAM